MKTCFKCNIKKSLTEYYKHSEMGDGHLNKCKTCTKKDANRTRAENLDYYIQYDRDRANLPHRVEARNEYRKTKQYKEAQKRGGAKWRKNNKYKRQAHSLVRNAILRGDIKVQPCIICGNKKAHGHHEDYKKPLELIWYCHKHHMEEHKRLRNL